MTSLSFPQTSESVFRRPNSPTKPHCGLRAGSPRTSAGFTLIEIMIVVVIIAMLATLAGPRLVGALSSSKIKTTQTQIETLAAALDGFNLDVGRYPTQSEGLEVLVKQTTPPILGWKGPYLKKTALPKDGWGRPFRYEIPPTHGGVDFDIYSLGRDGKPGGKDEDADIGNWESAH